MSETTPTQLKLSDLNRRQIRYICFRLQTEATGGHPATKEKTGLMSLVEDVKKNYEEQAEFGGWANFAKTWDVDNKAVLVAVLRTSSIYTDWNKVLKEETKELPPEPITKEIPVTEQLQPTPPPEKKKRK
jgi:hypothetical protein